MFNNIKLQKLFILSLFVLFSCGASLTYMKFARQLDQSLKTGQYDIARNQVKEARKERLYTDTDRLLYYLDLGAIEHYAGAYEQSNAYLNRAEQTIEELFTRKVSQIALSYLMNDNVTDYWGETYESIYIHVFKALNFSHLENQEAALVEIRKVNIKLQEMEDRYGSFLGDLASEHELDLDVDAPFYSDVLAHYLSAYFYNAQQEPDQSFISLKKLRGSWNSQKNIYQSDFPDEEKFLPEQNKNLSILAFTGSAPQKIEAGGMITTYEDFIGITDLSNPVAFPNIPFPGSKPGYHFKFAFPVLQQKPSKVRSIGITIDGRDRGTLHLLEDMGRIAEHTFENHKMYIYIKTLIRTVTKGIAAAEAKEKIKKETEADGILGAFIDLAVDVGVDATERADLRSWKTMPQHCYVGNFKLPPGTHQIQLQFLDDYGHLIKEENRNFTASADKIKLLEFIALH